MLFNSHEFILLFLPLALAAHFLAARYSTVAAVLRRVFEQDTSGRG